MGSVFNCNLTQGVKPTQTTSEKPKLEKKPHTREPHKVPADLEKRNPKRSIFKENDIYRDEGYDDSSDDEVHHHRDLMKLFDKNLPKALEYAKGGINSQLIKEQFFKCYRRRKIRRTLCKLKEVGPDYKAELRRSIRYQLINTDPTVTFGRIDDVEKIIFELYIKPEILDLVYEKIEMAMAAE